MKNNKVEVIICLAFIIITIVIISVYKIIQNRSEKTFVTLDYSYSNVYDKDEFYTVFNCIMEYYNRLNYGNDVFDLLSNKFIEKESINSSNVYNYIEEKYQLYNYSLDELHLYSNTYYKIYLAVGRYDKEELDEVVKSNNVSHIVIFDIMNYTYSIIPLSNQKNDFQSYLKDYDLTKYNESIVKNNNSIIYQEFSDDLYANYYFSKFKSLIFDDCEAVYDLLTNRDKKKYRDYDDFKKICKKYTTNYNLSKIEKYSLSDSGTKSTLSITDNFDNKITFKIDNVNEYTVSIVLQ